VRCQNFERALHVSVLDDLRAVIDAACAKSGTLPPDWSAALS